MDSSNGQLSLPAGLAEADLLDLVEGTLPREREGAVIAALKARPELALLVKSLREDRVQARALGGPVRAPAGLVDAIEGRLVHDALDALAHAEAAPDAIPVHRDGAARAGRLHAFVESPWTRRLATAASLAIVAGMGVWATRELVRSWPRVPERLIADQTTPVAPVEPPGSPNTRESDPGETLLADGTPPEYEPMGPPAELAGDLVEPALTVAQAAELAGEGRLVITLRSPRGAVQTVTRRMEGLIRGSSPDLGWHGWVGGSVALLPVEYAALTVPSRWPELGGGVHGAPRPEEPVIAGDEGVGAPGVAPQAPEAPDGSLLPFPARRPVVWAVYTLRLAPTERDLAALLRELEADGEQPVLRALEVPLAEPLSLEPEAVLWWSAPPGTWTRRVTVPVVVETLE